MTLEGQDLEAEAEKIKAYWLGKVKLFFLCLLLLTATIAFASSLRILFILSPRLAVILGLFTFIGISLWNLRHMQEVNPTKLCCLKEIYSKKLRIKHQLHFNISHKNSGDISGKEAESGGLVDGSGGGDGGGVGGHGEGLEPHALLLERLRLNADPPTWIRPS